ncbi:MAG: HIT family protein [archaeon]
MKDCIFCKISKGEIPSERIYESQNFFSIFDHSPHIEGHVLVISKKHFKNILEMPSSLGGELLDTVKKTALKLVEKYKSNGFNLVVNTNEAAGQEVDHVHVHILPRKKGDGFRIFVPK